VDLVGRPLADAVSARLGNAGAYPGLLRSYENPAFFGLRRLIQRLAVTQFIYSTCVIMAGYADYSSAKS
jgi:hypothetical protein